MKKTVILFLNLIILLVFLIPQPVYAVLVNNDSDIEGEFIKQTSGSPIPNIESVYVPLDSTDLSWTYTLGSDIYDSNIYIKSPRIEIDTDYLQNVQIPNYVVHRSKTGVYTVQTSAFTSAYIYVYNSADASYQSSSITLNNFGPGGQSYYKLNTPVAINGTKWIQIVYTISLYSVPGQDLSNNTHKLIKDWFDGLNWTESSMFPNNFQNRMRRYTASIRASFNHEWINLESFFSSRNYFSKITIREQVEFTPPNPDDPINPGNYNSVSDLPSTTGSIYTNTSEMGRVFFNVNGYNIIAKVEYGTSEYYIPFTMASGTDMSIFNNANKSFYYMYEGERFFLINHGSDSIFQSSNVSAQPWVGYSIWNLNTNELNTFDRLNVYLYSKLEEANNVYGYFYMDDFVIDHLLSVSLSMRYRYTYLFGQSDWTIYNKVLEANVYETFDPTSWQVDVLLGTAAATSVLALIPGVQIPALVIGSAVMAGVGSTIQSTPIAFGSINQIEKINPTAPLLSEIKSAYTEANPNFNANVTNMNIYKLYIGQFNDVWSTGIDIDTEYSLYQQQRGINIIQMSFVKDSQLYVIEGKDIGVIFKPGDGTDGENPGVRLPDINLMEFLGLISGAAVSLFVLVASYKSYITRRGFKIKPFIGALIGGLILGLLVGVVVHLITSSLSVTLLNTLKFLR